jgi:hypothetical protein
MGDELGDLAAFLSDARPQVRCPRVLRSRCCRSLRSICAQMRAAAAEMVQGLSGSDEGVAQARALPRLACSTGVLTRPAVVVG